MAGWVVGLTFFEMEWKALRARVQRIWWIRLTLSMRTTVSSQYRAIVRDVARENGIFFSVPAPDCEFRVDS